MIQRIGYTTINWIDTNKKGMTFGVLFGGAFLTFLGMLKRRSHRNGFVNSLLGFATGTPLGVCVNCAAPIARGMHDAGARIETTLATLISSPTMNVVVLTMLFSIFPIYVGLIKVAMTLLFILVIIPLLAHYIFPAERDASGDSAACCLVPQPEFQASEGWLQATIGALHQYLKNLWYIVRTTVPLMLVAGFLGSAIITLVPLESLIDSEITILGVFIVAIVGVFLPVPIAFDVIVTAALLAAGLPMLYVMILLVTLGTFSIYSFMIVWNSISRRVALTLYASVAALGIITGIAINSYHEWELERMLDIFGSEVEAADRPIEHHGIRITRAPFEERSESKEIPFSRVEGSRFGLQRTNHFSVADFWPPFYNGRGVASGDIDRDGWQDLAFATEQGVLLYRNERGTKFTPITLAIPQLEKLNTFVIALVDIDNDSWLDLYLTSYLDGNYYVLNRNGQFSTEQLHRTPTKDNVLSYAISFGDIDRDGDLDAAIGNWFYGFAKPIPPVEGTNKLHLNQGSIFSEAPLEGLTGETLTILLSDFNHDQKLDLMVGNDFIQPDVFYTGSGDGAFEQITAQAGTIPASTNTTMSIDTADINNDLITDIYAAQIAASASSKAAGIRVRRLKHYCMDVEDPGLRATCQQNVDIRQFFHYRGRHKPTDLKKCKTIPDIQEQQACFSMMVMKTATRERKPALCKHIPKTQEQAAHLCRSFFKKPVTTTKEEYRRALPQRKNKNVLLVGGNDGIFRDQAPQLGVDMSGWSWNSKIADLDNDQWQDIYVVNGTWLRGSATPSNFFFHNQQGKHFNDSTQQFGLDEFMLSSAYTYVDFDNDGDLDIVTTIINGPIRIFINNQSGNNAIRFALRDNQGNRFGIGSRIVIHYGEQGELHQMREIKAGGGFISFDAPLAHFGLGKHEAVERVEIYWSTGEKSELSGPFQPGRYTLERDA
ncbi:hypothetical protein BOW53_12975 [Solemya pervernicosa gill symbiont]|uniref:ASPIC/UnbV domain-containing protein n=1 Tax=Solemya pervernicosa gill symbiont TaxID=642797 RepID=A0A1T2L1V8_9GAMM|nr:FG-GAP-like repeat-containing protein [Solemya pervernicosa gill symbiont]OOZ39085.1 hypothetical protein BOW53_12975 [Solemya pervernicosa gill symbiont]